MERSRQQKTSLFARIMLGLSFPLFFLGAAFVGLQLTNQVNSMNLLHRVESRFAFESLEKMLRTDLKKPETYTQLATYEQGLKNSASFLSLSKVRIYDALERKSLLPGDNTSWSKSDLRYVEESLSQKERGKSYLVTLNKENKQLIAYIPVKGGEKTQLFVAKAVFSLANIRTALSASRTTLAAMLFFIALAGLVIGQSLSQSIVKPIRKLNEATQEIMQGKLGKQVEIHTGDEIEALARTFNKMSGKLQEMQAMARDANPLTGLPGNHGIFQELQRRIHERQKFVLFHTDLNRFKVFNDHYGLAKGDDAITTTAQVLKDAVKEKGAADDFIGHQGGDDFVLITRPNKAQELGALVCQKFDGVAVPKLYTKEDLAKGYTEHLDRRRETETGEKIIVKFPLLSLGLAGVSNIKKDFTDYEECMGMAVEAKKEVKKIIESAFMIIEK